MSTNAGNIHVKRYIDDLNETLESNQPPDQVNFEIKKFLLSLNPLKTITEDPKKLVANIKRLLIESTSESELDFDLILELLNTLINKCCFEVILEVFSIDDLKMALKSTLLPLVNAACNVISRSYPKGLFATSDLFDVIIGLYFNIDTDVSVINSIEKVFEELSSNELVRKRIFENNSLIIDSVRRGTEPTLISRLLELLKIESKFIDRCEFDEKLFSFTSQEIFNYLKADIVLFINIVVYYTDFLDEATVVDFANKNTEWLLKYVLEIIPTFGKIYSLGDNYPDIRYFSRTYLFKFFRKVSYLEDDSYFKSLDEKYLRISEQNKNLKDFLSFVNPAYLFRYHCSLLRDYITVTPTKLGAIRNVISDPQCFELIKNHLTSDAILLLPYMEQMVLLQRLSLFSHSVYYLVHSLPRVMSNLIQNSGDISEPETASLREEAIVNLLRFNSTTLNVWYIPLTDALAKISNPKTKHEPEPQLASSFI